MERRILAAAATPLKDGGAALDEDAFGPLVEFLHAGGLDGILALGTTGEGILLSVEERKRAAELFVSGALDVIVHAGAQTTAATVELAQHAASLGAAAVAVIAPPYFRLDDEALLLHFLAAASACAPLPFYVYEFEAVSGYAFPPDLLPRLREDAPNLVGMKVSDTPYESFARYLGAGLDVFVGPEAFIGRGLEEGAVGAVSGLATAFPDLVAALDPRLAELRATIEGYPRHSALKHVLGRRGVPVREDVRRPLRQLTDGERQELDEWLDELS